MDNAFLRLQEFLSAIAGILLTTACAAQYNGPESVEHDPVSDRYFVSNTQNDLIRVQDQAGDVTTFVDVGSAPYGLEILGDTLFVCTGSRVKGYLLGDATLVFDLDLGASFLNGITTDGEFIYVTAFSGAKVYKVDPVAATFEVLVANTNGTPNGIVWDPAGERLVVVFWGSNAPIKAYDRVTGAAITLLANSGVGSIDGVTIDCLGNFLIASWSPARITRFEPTFTQPGVNAGITGLSNPADIDFDTVHNRVCIPNAGSNTVLLADVDCTNSIMERRTYTTRVMPNPTSGLVRFDPPLQRAEPFMVLDARGLLQAHGTLRANALLDMGEMPPGIYTILFTRRAEQVRVVKE
ncbi:MAG: SMP-30/gluconolactonase/LRE family protein [Flavobacteriales bacterium]|nr:SMP-30/gluconolactonase/LRE family protein [Flavobacteriales bacterium]